jgi:hypothetical protein
LTSQTLHFGDPERQIHVNGSEVLSNSDSMLTIAVDAESQPVLFNARRYAGSPSYRNITGYGMTPDLVWIKERSYAQSHYLFDTIRGHSEWISSDANTAQTQDTTSLTEFLDDGFRLAGGDGKTNEDAQTYVAWAWKAGGTPSAYGKKKINGTESAITLASGVDQDGDYYNLKAHGDSSYGMKQSINTTGGFSITKFSVGGTSGNGWFKHGFSGDPDWVIIRRIDGTYNWDTWHSGLTTSWNTNQTLRLNTNDSLVSGRGDIFKDSSTTGFPKGDGKIYIDRGAIYGSDADDEFICYAWKAVSGVSAFGSYFGKTGGGGNRVYFDSNGDGSGTGGFRPRFIMTKLINFSSSYGSWSMIDASRSDFGTSGTTALNATDTKVVYADQSKVENQRAGSTDASTIAVTIYDDGFQFTATNTETNVANDAYKYIYMAFA